MARRGGPKPRPTNLRVIEGNIGGGNPVKSNEPKPPIPPTCPQPPSWLSPYATEEWDRVAPTLWMIGSLTDVDTSMLGTYCDAFGRYRQAVEDFKAFETAQKQTHGVVMKTQSGNYIQNPLLGTINVLRRDALRLAAEFGLTPSSRTTIEALECGTGCDAIAAKYGLR